MTQCLAFLQWEQHTRFSVHVDQDLWSAEKAINRTCSPDRPAGHDVVEEEANIAEGTPPKRGKKRAQQEEHGPPHVVQLEATNADDIDIEPYSMPAKLNKFGNRRFSYPAWLHPAFHVADDGIMPRPFRHHIEL